MVLRCSAVVLERFGLVAGVPGVVLGWFRGGPSMDLAECQKYWNSSLHSKLRFNRFIIVLNVSLGISDFGNPEQRAGSWYASKTVALQKL